MLVMQLSYLLKYIKFKEVSYLFVWLVGFILGLYPVIFRPYSWLHTQGFSWRDSKDQHYSLQSTWEQSLVGCVQGQYPIPLCYCSSTKRTQCNYFILLFSHQVEPLYLLSSGLFSVNEVFNNSLHLHLLFFNW